MLTAAWEQALSEKIANQPLDIKADLRMPHMHQQLFIDSPAKRIIIRAGRRGGKTVGAATLAVKRFAAGRRVLYAAPTSEQIDAFWFEVKRALQRDLEREALYKNETDHVIEVPGTKQRIRAKTAWNAETMRGDYADVLILDEFQLMNEDTWEIVGAPMLLDNDGDAVLIYTPPSIRSAGISKARDPRHAAKMFQRAQSDTSGRWASFHFTSRDNPHISADALRDIARDMTSLAIRQEIDAEDIEDVPGALWTHSMIDAARVSKPAELYYIAVGLDPSATSHASSDEAGIIVAGAGMCDCKGIPEQHAFILDDSSLLGSPAQWAMAAVSAFHRFKASGLFAESNQGGEMVALTISTIRDAPGVTLIHANQGKRVRAEPVVALYEQGRVHHVGILPGLEDEMCSWMATSSESPNRIDAMVYAVLQLGIGAGGSLVAFEIDE